MDQRQIRGKFGCQSCPAPAPCYRRRLRATGEPLRALHQSSLMLGGPNLEPPILRFLPQPKFALLQTVPKAASAPHPERNLRLPSVAPVSTQMEQREEQGAASRLCSDGRERHRTKPCFELLVSSALQQCFELGQIVEADDCFSFPPAYSRTKTRSLQAGLAHSVI